MKLSIRVLAPSVVAIIKVRTNINKVYLFGAMLVVGIVDSVSDYAIQLRDYSVQFCPQGCRQVYDAVKEPVRRWVVLRPPVMKSGEVTVSGICVEECHVAGDI